MTPDLTAVTVFDEAKTQVQAAARAMLLLLAATLRAQFSTGAYLVLTNEPNDHDEPELHLHSVRDAEGELLWDFPHGESGYDPLPRPVPAGLATLWGTSNPQDPGKLVFLVNDVWEYVSIEHLPEHVRQASERDAVYPPFGIPLTPGTDAYECAAPCPKSPAHNGPCT